MTSEMWPCESCHSLNAPKATRCYSCRMLRGAAASSEPLPRRPSNVVRFLRYAPDHGRVLPWS